MNPLLLLGLSAVALALAALVWWWDRRSASRRAFEPAAGSTSDGDSGRERGVALPGAVRRERRAWAHEHGFAFVRADDYLAEEWERGAATGGDVARDVVAGTLDGRAFHVADLGAASVMAIRRPVGSDVVLDLRRRGVGAAGDAAAGEHPAAAPARADEGADAGAEDAGRLEYIEETQGFDCWATSPAARWVIDDRVRSALAALPSAVRAVWCESDWTIAEAPRGTRVAAWEEAVASLGVIADAACALPPRGDDIRDLSGLALIGPTRLMARATAHDPAALTSPGADGDRGVAADPAGGHAEERRLDVAESTVHGLVARPEEPVALPSRTESRSFGEPADAERQRRDLGSDDVEAIGDELEAPDDRHGTRMLRRSDRPPSIFGDVAERLGHDPLAGLSDDPGSDPTPHHP